MTAYRACLFYKTALTASAIKIIPPEISRILEGNFLKRFPNQNPKSDIKKDAHPITSAGSKISAPLKLMLAPAARASILVAIPIVIRHVNPIQQTGSYSFFSNASIINFIPRIINIVKTSQWLKASTYLFIKLAKTYPIAGITP